MWLEQQPILHFGWMREEIATSLLAYRNRIKVHQYGNEISNEVINFKGTLRKDEFIGTLKRYSVGLIDYPNDVVNENLCAPTKLFDYLKFGIMPVCLNSEHLLDYWFPELGVGCSLDQLIRGYSIADEAVLKKVYQLRRKKRLDSLLQLKEVIS